MNIKYKDYTLIQQESGFDLIETVKAQRVGTGTIKQPNGEFYDKEIGHGYNMSLETCIIKIVHFDLLGQNKMVELKEYLESYRSLVTELKDTLK